MKYRSRTHRRWLARMALGLAVAAVAAPSGQAFFAAGDDVTLVPQSRPCAPNCMVDSQPTFSGPIGPIDADPQATFYGPIGPIDADPAGVAQSVEAYGPIGPVYADPAGVVQSPKAYEPIGPVYADPAGVVQSEQRWPSFDAPLGDTAPKATGGRFGAPNPATPGSGVSIDWVDGGIGAGIAVGVMLLAGAAALGVRQSRRLAHS